MAQHAPHATAQESVVLLAQGSHEDVRERERHILWQDSQQGSYHDATRKRLIAPQLQFTVSKVVVGSCSKT